MSLQRQRHKIRMMILSDTHGKDLANISASLPRADVVLHCGDLTNDSQPAELERTLAMLRSIDAPLKLAIPGNHDFGLEKGYWRPAREQAQAYSHSTQQQRRETDKSTLLEPAQTTEAENDPDARASWELLRRAAQDDRIFLLPQGTHTFVLPQSPDSGSNGIGARLRLFASPLTPRGGNWGFQYDRSNPHRWAIPSTPTSMSRDGDGADGAVDVMMTHGPPMGIRDGTGMGRKGRGHGCAALLAAVERGRPLVHCFGHIHGAWGAEMIAWKRDMEMVVSGAGPSAPTCGNLVDAERSRVVASLASPIGRNTLLVSAGAGAAESAISTTLSPATMTTMQRHHSRPKEESRCCAVDISPDGEHAVERGGQTLFVNAAVELWPESGSTLPQSRMLRAPWLVDMDLPVASEEDIDVAAETINQLLEFVSL